VQSLRRNDLEGNRPGWDSRDGDHGVAPAGHAGRHVCGDPSLPPEADRALRRRLIEQALQALERDVSQPTLIGAA
jgi:hypothetical protein